MRRFWSSDPCVVPAARFTFRCAESVRNTSVRPGLILAPLGFVNRSMATAKREEATTVQLTAPEVELRNKDITKAGKRTTDISVRISPRSIELFSQGLYRSPHKAIEELVANAFDAGASDAHIILRRSGSHISSIIVIDNGTGMDAGGLQQHWLIGESNKRDPSYSKPSGRNPIGKFGIGKLATFVLTHKFTLISKRGGRYFAATMDYDRVSASATSATAEKQIRFPVRELTKAEAEAALGPYVTGSGAGYDAIKLFGVDAPANWTVAVLTDLKPLVNELKEGVLKWVLSTAMPMGDDFKLYLDGNRVDSSRAEILPQKSWILGKDFSPKTPGFSKHEDKRRAVRSPNRYSVEHPQLGRLSGTIEVFRDPIIGKPDRIGRNNGFFVYIRERLVNEDDAYFGISESKLRHGTLARFRMTVRAENLDADLLSSREDVQKTSKLDPLHELLEEAFNVARNYLNTLDDGTAVRIRAADRFAGSPRSTTTIPVLSMLQKTFENKASPFLTRVDPEPISDSAAFLRELSERLRSGTFFRIEHGALSQDDGIAILDINTGILTINTQHPFVATFVDDFSDSNRNEPLELFAVSEVLLEASLYETISNSNLVREVIDRRDGLLRALAKDSARRNASLIALTLFDSRNSPTAFEYAVVDAFSSMGFIAQRIGGKGKLDGIAEARITGADGKRRAYKVSLEAKTVQTSGKKSTHTTVKPSTVTRHRDAAGCDFALVIGESYSDAEGSALLSEVSRNNSLEQLAGHDKAITLIRLADLQRLVRLMPVKKIGLDKLREMFLLGDPDEVATFISKLEHDEQPRKHFQDILQEIGALQQEKDTQVIAYEALQVGLRLRRQIDLELSELMETCKAMHSLSGGLVYAYPNNVELSQSPAFIVDVIASSIRSYPEDMRSIASEVLKQTTAVKARGIKRVLKRTAKRTRRRRT